MTCLYLLNGWAMSPTALQPLSNTLEKWGIQTEIISLEEYSQPSLSQSLQVLKNRIPPHSSVAGWSLGGMLAQQLALTQPTLHLIGLANNLRFVASADWATAMPPEDFTLFHQQQKQNPARNLKQFIRLCYAGEAQLRTTAQTWLKHNCHSDQLLWGLELLAQLDASACLNLALPQLYLFAEQDALVPYAVSSAMKQRWPQLQVDTVAGSHAFPVSQSVWVAERIHSFLSNHTHDEQL